MAEKTVGVRVERMADDLVASLVDEMVFVKVAWMVELSVVWMVGQTDLKLVEPLAAGMAALMVE